MKSDLRKTKIVGTIGPASENRLKELFDAGLNVCRINYSHGSYDEQEWKTQEIIKIREENAKSLIFDMAEQLITENADYLGQDISEDAKVKVRRKKKEAEEGTKDEAETKKARRVKKATNDEQ